MPPHTLNTLERPSRLRTGSNALVEPFASQVWLEEHRGLGSGPYLAARRPTCVFVGMGASPGRSSG